MRTLQFSAFLLFSVSSLAFAATTDSAITTKQAIDLDSRSRATLGISLRAVALLLRADGPHLYFFRKDSLVEDGSWDSLNELERAGYATVKVVKGIPNGEDPDVEQVIIKLTESGKAVALALKRRA